MVTADEERVLHVDSTEIRLCVCWLVVRTLYTVSQKSKQNYFYYTSNFHQIWQFLAQWWQIV